MALDPDPFVHSIYNFFEDSVACIHRCQDREHYREWARENGRQYISALIPDATEREGSQFAVCIAQKIWTSVPLSSHNFKPGAWPLPKRNEPCLCGSGRKYKQCCAHVPLPPFFEPTMAWPILLPLLSQEEQRQALKIHAIPLDALAGAAAELLEANSPGKAVKLLEPVFQTATDRLGEEADFLLNLLCDAYTELGHHKKKQRFLDTMKAQGPKPLRAGAWQRLASMYMDAGEQETAWQAFRQAQRLDPNNPSIHLLEITLLLSQSDFEMARQRAELMIRQLDRAGLPDDDPSRQFLHAVAEDPAHAFLGISSDGLNDEIQQLANWLESVTDRPVPRYTLQREELSASSQSDAYDGQLPLDLPSEGEPLWDEPELGAIMTAPDDVQAVTEAWQQPFPFPKPFSTNFVPFLEEEDPWDAPAWLAWLLAHPQAFDSLSVIDDLVTAVCLLTEAQSPWYYERVLQPLFSRVHAILDRAGDARPLPWIHPENRNLLRPLAQEVYYLEEFGDPSQAVAAMEQLLRLNPNDNHGYRALLANSWLHNSENEKVLQLAAHYPDDHNLEIVYGQILALYRLDRREEAALALESATERFPHASKYLVTKKIKQPRIDARGYTLGGEDQAWLYRQAMRDTWQAEPGALAWLNKMSSG